MNTHAATWLQFLTLPFVWESAVILISLAIIFAASWVMFDLLAMRSTSQRYWVALEEWGEDREIWLRPAVEDRPPAPFDQITSQRLKLQLWLGNRQSQLIQLRSFSNSGPAAPGEEQVREGLWHLLIREIDLGWPPTGLRPTAASSSVLDLFSLTSYPQMGASERFVVYGSSSGAASALAHSSVRGLLPSDVGVLLHGRRLVLDFSDRPFDTVEFDRMLAVAEQLVSHLSTFQGGHGKSA